MAFLDLPNGVGVVVTAPSSASTSPCNGTIDVRSHGNIATVQHLGPAVERVRVEWNVVSTAETHFT